MGIFRRNQTGITRDGGKIGLPFSYLQLRDPRIQEIAISDLIPEPVFATSASDEFYAKFYALILGGNFHESVFGTWAVVYKKHFDSYMVPNLDEESERRFYMAATTGYLMAVSEDNVFGTFRRGFMASYIPGAIQNYIQDKEASVATSEQVIAMNGVYSGYHKAHEMHN